MVGHLVGKWVVQLAAMMAVRLVDGMVDQLEQMKVALWAVCLV